MFNILNAAIFAVMAIASYMLGNISPATVVGKLHGVDIRKEGSGNPGTTNVLRTLGAKAALCTLLIDVLKGVIPVIAGRLVGGELLACICGTAAFVGHIWPVCFGFKGGKGIATGFGVIVSFCWPAGLVCLVFAIGGAALTRRMSVGSITAALSLPVAIYFFNPSYLFWSLGLMAVVILRHRTNIARLIRGEEPKMNFSKKSKADDEKKEKDHE